MWRTLTISAVALGALLIGSVALSFGQTTSAAKACRLVPTAALETHFGEKVSAVRGSDTATVSMCSADIPDRRHGADLTSRPPGPVLTVEQRLAAMRSTLERNGSEIKNFGAVGCFTDNVPMADKKLPTTACFLEKGGYLSLSLRSDNPKHLSFDAVKDLLEKAAAQRK